MKNNTLSKNSKYKFIKKALISLYGQKDTQTILNSAEIHYAHSAAVCKNATAGEWKHLNNTILPTIATYKALLEFDKETALKNTHKIIIDLCLWGNKWLNRFLMLPAGKSIFMKLLPRMAIKLFGKECGFDYENYTVTRTLLQMDMTVCPYCKYAKILDCPELTPIFCESDFATYGNLRGIKFERTETLGTGGKKCDFRFERTS